MDDLYIESFSIKGKKNAPLSTSAPVNEIATKNTLTETPVKFDAIEDHLETLNQNKFYFDQLERALASDIKNPEDYRFILARIKEKINDSDSKSLLKLFNELEELLDTTL